MKSPTTKLQKHCDALIQQIGKLKWPHSLISGLPTQVIHHFHPKSVSNALRYDWANLVPLTNGEHMRHHQAGDPAIHGAVIQKRGKKWHDTLLKRRWQESVKTDKAYYMNVKIKLEKELESILYLNSLVIGRNLETSQAFFGRDGLIVRFNPEGLA